MWVCSECRGPLSPYTATYLSQSLISSPVTSSLKGRLTCPSLTCLSIPRAAKRDFVAQVQSVPVSDSCCFSSWQLFVIHTPDRRAAGWSNPEATRELGASDRLPTIPFGLTFPAEKGFDSSSLVQPFSWTSYKNPDNA